MNESGTFLGYIRACPACGHDAYLVPDVDYGPAGYVNYRYRIDCTHCDLAGV